MRLRDMAAYSGAGARDKWVTIQALQEDTDGGFPVDGGWLDLATVAMAREDVELTEDNRSGQTTAIAITNWEMPYRADMDPERVDVQKLRRLKYLERVYDIIGATPIRRARAISLSTAATSKTPTV